MINKKYCVVIQCIAYCEKPIVKHFDELEELNEWLIHYCKKNWDLSYKYGLLPFNKEEVIPFYFKHCTEEHVWIGNRLNFFN